jgi:hypothetical protein
VVLLLVLSLVLLLMRLRWSRAPKDFQPLRFFAEVLQSTNPGVANSSACASGEARITLMLLKQSSVVQVVACDT